jgi:hypothetical protein
MGLRRTCLRTVGVSPAVSGASRSRRQGPDVRAPAGSTPVPRPRNRPFQRLCFIAFAGGCVDRCAWLFDNFNFRLGGIAPVPFCRAREIGSLHL